MEKIIALTIPGQNGESVAINPPDGIPHTDYTIGILASGAINIAMVVGILLSLLYLVYGGFFWLQSKGDKQQLDKARRIIVYAIIGLIIMSLSLLIVNVITSALNVEGVLTQ